MKFTIRNNIWETNSSSVHAIAISKKHIDIKDQVTPYFYTINFDHGEFGWEHALYGDTNSKASYLYQAIWSLYPAGKWFTPDENKKYQKEREKIINWIYEVLTKYGFNPVFDNNNFDADGWSKGYIDHGNELKDFVEKVTSNEKRLLSFLFGDSVICTGNDNDDMDDICKFYEDYPEKDYEIYRKGN